MPRITPSAAPTPSTATDRKSTRLNSSHSHISYAVFCLKKKKRTPAALPGRGQLMRHFVPDVDPLEVAALPDPQHRGGGQPGAQQLVARFVFLRIRPPPRSTLFPYTTLFR